MADDFSTCDALRDLDRSKLLDGNLAITWGECKESLEGKRTHLSYLEGLCLLWSNAETRDTRKREQGSESVVYTDSLRDLKRSKIVHKDSDITWDERKKLLENKNADVHYLESLHSIWKSTEEKDTRKRERKNEDDQDGDDSDEDDTDDDDNDPQYESFLANLKEHDRSYALKVDNNGETSLLAYEEVSSDDASEFKGRKMKKIGVEPKDMLCIQKLGFLNNTKTVNKNENFCECSKKLMDLHVREDVDRSDNEISIWKRDNELLIKNQVNSRNGVTRKNIDEGNLGAGSKAIAQIDFRHVHLTSGQSGSWNRTKGPENLEKVVKRMTVAKSDHEGKRKSSPKKIFLSGNTVECVNEAPVEKEKIHRKNLAETAKGKNVVNRDHGVNRKEMTLLNKNHPSLKSSASNRVKEVSEKNVAEANGKVVVRIRNQLFYQKPAFGNNGVKENPKDKARDNQKKLNGIVRRETFMSGVNKKASILIEQDRPVKKEAVKGREELKNVVKVEKVVKENNVISAQKTTLRTRGRPKKQIDNSVHIRSSRQSNHGKFLHKNHDGGASSDFEILENVDEVITDLLTEEDLKRILRVDMDTEYAKKLMSILKKPFDNREYKKLSDCIQVYYKAYPSLKRKMTKYRYKPAKRLNIIRGFFYWLQHCVAEGAFKPWQEKKCLAVEPERN